MVEWTKFEDNMPEEKESIFARYYGTNKWKEGIMFRTTRYGLLFTVEKDGERVVVRGKMIDGKPKADMVGDNVKFIAWMPYPDPFMD